MLTDCGPDGSFVKIELPKDLENIKYCIKYINDNRRNHLFIAVDFVYSGNKIPLDFLKDLKYPEIVDIVTLWGNFGISDAIYRFTELKELSYCPEDIELLDLERFSKLIELDTTSPLSLRNMYKSSVQDYSQLNDGDAQMQVMTQFPNLKRLYLHGPSGFTFTGLAGNETIKDVGLTECNIKDFAGIERLKGLEGVDLSYCRSLQSIEGISEAPNLDMVALDSCPRLKDLSEIGRIPKLRALFLESMKNRDLSFLYTMQSKETLQFLMLKSCGEIPSIKFLEQCPKLEGFDCYQTNVLDGDLKFLLTLESARITNKRHYNVKEKDLPFGRGLYSWKRK